MRVIRNAAVHAALLLGVSLVSSGPLAAQAALLSMPVPSMPVPSIQADSMRLPSLQVDSMQPAALAQSVDFTVSLPLRNGGQLDQLLQEQHDENSPNYRHWLSAAEFEQRFGPNPADVAAVTAELAAYRLQVVGTHAHGLQIRGSVADVQRAFHTHLSTGLMRNGSRRMVSNGPITVPATLARANAVVLGFSSAARMHAHSIKTAEIAPDNRYSPVGPYWFDDLKQAYNFPSYQAFAGCGRNIGILMANDFSDADLTAYFAHEKLAAPTVVRVPVDGGAPFDANLSFEVSLDVQQSGGMAPGATIIDYNIPNLLDQSIIDGLVRIVEDNQADIVSMSFGGPEIAYTAAYNNGVDQTRILRIMDDLFKRGNAQGITFVASSGDNGALGAPPLAYFTTAPQTPAVTTGSWGVGIEFPASSPHVTAVGGTNLVTASSTGLLDSTYVRENAFADPEIDFDPYGAGNLISGGYWGSGGGVSILFHRPAYQRLVETGSRMRTIPDLSLHMGGCPTIALQPCGPDRSADLVAEAGAYYGVIGTSASAPDFAGVLALTEERLGGFRLGNANQFIYSLAAAQNFGWLKIFHQGIPGFNGFYFSGEADTSYNYVLGNGTLSVRDFMLVPAAPPAGTPQTPSNP